MRESVYELFNSFLTNVIKEIYSNMPRHKPFWTMVNSKGITLISKSEVSESNVTIEMASKFLLDDDIMIVEEVVKEKIIEEDDMFADME